MAIKRSRTIAKAAVFISAIVIAFLAGVVHLLAMTHVLDGSPVIFAGLFGVGLLVLTVTWIVIDSRQLAYQCPRWLTAGIVLAAAIFVPVYFFKTRTLGVAAAMSLAFFAIVAGLPSIGSDFTIIMLSMFGW